MYAGRGDQACVLMEAPMTVSELARKAGVHLETVRYYEREGLLPEPERTSGGHRIYREQDAARLRFIQHAKDVGFTLKEVQELLRLREAPDATCADVAEIARRKLGEIEGKIALLRGMKDHLVALLTRCPGNEAGVEDCTILEGLSSDCCEGSPPRGGKG
jgi:Hg(II)-responsive transcriptional regulator